MKDASVVNTLVTDIWCEILGVETVQANESFFDLAGTSLAAEQIAARIGDSLAVTIDGSDIMRSRTLSNVVSFVVSRVA